MEMTKNQRVKSVISYTGMSVNSFSKKSRNKPGNISINV